MAKARKKAKMQESPRSVLFVCYANQNRSPTAELVFKQELEKRGYKEAYNGLENEVRVNSAGVNANPDTYDTQMTRELGDRAEWIVTFSRNLKAEIILKFHQPEEKITDLSIPDRYHCGEPALMDICRSKLQPYMNRWYPPIKQ